MSKLKKLVEVLDLFSEEVTVLSADDVADRLGTSRTTGFRYVKELSEVGFLAKFGSRYALGPRIIELDFRIRRSDPMLKASRDLMRRLSDMTSCNVLISSLLGEQLVNIHHESARHGAAVTFGRGRPLPLFRGAASKSVLAYLPTPRLRRLYERHVADADLCAQWSSWAEFSKYFKRVRQDGYYISREEVDPGIVGIGSPVFGDNNAVAGSLVLVFEKEREALINESGFAELVKSSAAQISASIASATEI